MSQLKRSIAAVVVLGAAAVAFATYAGGARAAVAPAGNPAGAAMLAGSEVAVVVATFHNAQHTNVTTITVGTTVHVRVTLAGAFGTPTGTVFGSMYGNAGCTGTPVKQSGPGILDGPSLDLTAFTYKAMAAGKLSVLISYGGDDTYGQRYSACTAIDVTKATPSVGMVVHDGGHDAVTSLGIGGTVHAYVTINSRVGTPTGHFVVSWWKNGTCSGAKENSSINIGIGESGHSEATAFAKSASPVGSYAFKVHYEGDAGFKAGDSACAPYTVTKLTPVFEAQVHNFLHLPVSTLPLGAQVHPWASVAASGGGPTPTGNVSIKRYADDDCTNEVASTLKPADDSMEMTDLGVSQSTPGAQSWRIQYAGDAVYKAVGPASCIVRTWKAPSTLTFDIHDTTDHDTITSVVTGVTFDFRVAVAGSYETPDGVVQITKFSNGTCSGSGTLLATSPLNSGVGHDTFHKFSVSSAGSWSFRAEYPGDNTYFGDSTCEKLTVTEEPTTPNPTPTVKPTAKPAATPAGGDPGSSAAPGSSPAPTDVAPAASDEPAATTAAAPTSAPAASAPPASAGSGSGAGNGSGAGSGSGSGTEAPTSPSGDGGPGFAWILLLVLIVILVFGAGIALGRRRQPATKA